VPGLDEANYIAITNLIRTHHVWLIFNAEDAVWRPNAKNRDDFDVFNAAFLFNPEGRSRRFITNKSWSSLANTSRSCAGCRSSNGSRPSPAALRPATAGAV
jgi:hypothetical protein